MRVTPAFEIEELEGKVKHTLYKYEERKTGRKDRNGNDVVTHHLVTEEVEEPAGYMVYFPRGHSIRVRNDAELKRLGLDRSPYRTDLDGEVTDEELADPSSGRTSLKERSKMTVRQNTRGRGSRAASGSVDQLANPEGD